MRIIFISNHLTCSGKERFRHLLSIPGELLLTAHQSRKSVLHRLVLVILLGTPSAALEASGRQEQKQGFPAKKGLFPDLFVMIISEGSSVGTNATKNKKEHFPSFPERQSQKKSNHLRTAPFLDISPPFYHHGNGDAVAPARPRYLVRLSWWALVTKREHVC